MTCAEIRDRIPEFVAGRYGGATTARFVEHLRGCDVCSTEVDLIRALHADRPEVPAALEARVRDAVSRALAEDAASRPTVVPLSRSLRRSPIPSWALGMAAILALAIGTPLVVDRMQEAGRVDAAGQVVEEMSIASLWSGEDGLVAGAPMLDDLSDEALMALLEEMEEDA